MLSGRGLSLPTPLVVRPLKKRLFLCVSFLTTQIQQISFCFKILVGFRETVFRVFPSITVSVYCRGYNSFQNFFKSVCFRFYTGYFRKVYRSFQVRVPHNILKYLSIQKLPKKRCHQSIHLSNSHKKILILCLNFISNI